MIEEFDDSILPTQPLSHNWTTIKISAIKRARELARGRLGLKDAKDLVEQYIYTKCAEKAFEIIRLENPGLGCNRSWRACNFSQKDKLINQFAKLTGTGFNAAESKINEMWEHTQYAPSNNGLDS